MTRLILGGTRFLMMVTLFEISVRLPDLRPGIHRLSSLELRPLRDAFSILQMMNKIQIFGNHESAEAANKRQPIILATPLRVVLLNGAFFS